MKLRDSWMKSHLPEKYIEINKFIEDNNIFGKIKYFF